MTNDQRNKLVIQLLPAVAAAHTSSVPANPAQAKQMWADYLDEAASVASLFEQKFLKAEAEKILTAELIAQTI